MTLASEAKVRKVLVVDDEPFMRRMIKAVLRMAGKFLVEEADDGDAALALIPTFKPDIVLCDVQMREWADCSLSSSCAGIARQPCATLR